MYVTYAADEKISSPLFFFFFFCFLVQDIYICIYVRLSTDNVQYCLTLF